MPAERVVCDVREAKPADAQAVTNLLEQLGYRERVGDIAERLGMSGYQRQVYLAGGPDGDVMGCVAVALTIRIVGGLRADIESFVVEESVRGKGIGTLLLTAAEAWARSNGCTRLRLLSNVVRERAHAFYERNGYVKLKAEYVLEKQL